MARWIELLVITPAEVSAFVDGELTLEERQDVAACAHDDDQVASLINSWQWQIGLLHAAFGEIVDEPVPERLRHVLEGGSPRVFATAGRQARARPNHP